MFCLYVLESRDSDVVFDRLTGCRWTGCRFSDGQPQCTGGADVRSLLQGLAENANRCAPSPLLSRLQSQQLIVVTVRKSVDENKVRGQNDGRQGTFGTAFVLFEVSVCLWLILPRVRGLC